MAENVILSKVERSFSYNSTFGAYVSSDNNPAFSLVSGQEYRIVWDDVEYTRTAFAFTFADGSQCVGVGNPLAAGQTANDDKFCIVYDDTHKIVHYLSLEQTASHEVVIYQIVEDEQTATGTTVVLKDRNGNDLPAFEGVKGIDVLLKDGSTVTYVLSGTGDYIVTFMSEDGKEVLYEKPVMHGDTCGDVIALGLVPPPVKESTADCEYNFLGWSSSIGGETETDIFNTIVENKTVYAVFEAVPLLASGQCGDAAYWKLTDKGELVIYGTGDTYDYTFSQQAPWAAYANDIVKVTVASGISTIGKYLFYKSVNATDVVISEGVTTIRSQAFYNCTTLINITFPASLVLLEAGAFGNADTQKKVFITDLEKWASINFAGPNSNPRKYDLYENGRLVTEYIVSETKTTIGREFTECTSITSVQLHDRVETIGENSFYGCTKLESIYIPASVTSVGTRAFQGCAKLLSANIGDGMTEIPAHMFSGCSALKTTNIHANIKKIGSSAFENTALTSATFAVTTGWTAQYAGKTVTLSSSSLSSASTAATYLKTTYYYYEFVRS